MSGSDTSETAEAQEIQDPEGYVNKRRLETIFDIRNRMRESRQRIRLAQQGDRMSEFDALSAYRSMAYSYFIELEPILHRYEPGPTLISEQPFGNTKIGPRLRESPHGQTRQEIYLPDEGNGSDWLPVTHPPEPVTVEFRGLNTLTMDGPLQETFQVVVPRKGAVTTTVTQQFPQSVLDRMVRQMNNFLATIGFEIEPETSDEWEI